MKLNFNTDISKHAHKVMFLHMAITVDQPSLTFSNIPVFSETLRKEFRT